MPASDDDKLFEDAMRTLGVSRPSAPLSRDGADDDEALVRRMALGLEPLPGGPSTRATEKAPSRPEVAAVDWAEEDEAFEAAMADGELPGVLPSSHDTVTTDPTELARVHVGTPRALRRRIKQGLIRHDVELDLHGMVRDEAMSAVERVVASACREGLQVVRIITGRGLHSAGGEAVLMHALERWLEGPLVPWAYSSVIAPPSHGGEGVRYVFLRRFAPTPT